MSTKKINVVQDRSLRIILIDYEFLNSLFLEGAHQVTFHQQCIISLMTEVYKYLNGHSSDIVNNIFQLRENTHNLQNFHIFHTENPRSLKYRLWQQFPIVIR